MSNHALGKKARAHGMATGTRLVSEDAFTFIRAKTLDSGVVKNCQGACDYRKARQSSTLMYTDYVFSYENMIF
jgi:hypothetical protein